MAPARRDVPAAGNAPAPWRRRAWRACRAKRVRLLASALVLLAGAVLLPRERDAVRAAFANLFAWHQFAATLRPGREPLISRYTRFDYGHLPPDLAAYTRFLTLLWASLLAAFAAAQAAALAGRWPASSVLAVEIAACAALFLGEHLVRTWLFPHHGPITLRRTVRAVRLAHAAPRDAAAG